MKDLYDVTKLNSALFEYGITLSDEQTDKLLTYYEMLIEKNKVMNLTAITEYDEVILKHFVDSISLCQVMDLHKEIKVLDLGTGAGFPGIPLKIVFPERLVVIVYANQLQLKKLISACEYIAEIRRAPEIATFFDELTFSEQKEWCDDLVYRTDFTDSTHA